MRSVADLKIERVFIVCLLTVCSLCHDWLISVAVSRGRWGGSVWQHCQWRSSLSTFSVHRGSDNHETSKL